ncbi:ABC transporter substrate-binding protein [Rhizobium sp. 2MFCol3.1]|uniref:ABC transporter substrate-binding protein n=1 Tax=Rhizobium sp. 2MFCol3.1 TaxID=1246459 RepID=UPI0003A64458|nr:ABC transporter substrate-binding protein [Rhizobium sp. 2MFCol3.1]
MDRREFLKLSAAGLAVAGMGLGRPAFAQAKALSFCSWGGSTQDAQNAAWGVPFTKDTGYSILNDGPTDYGKLKAMIDSGNVSWDVVDMEAQTAYQFAKMGLLESIDYSVVSRDGLDPVLNTDFGVGSFKSSWVLGYNTDFLPAEPTSWADLFDLKKFPGKRALFKWSGMGALQMALLADGVAPDALYPLDVDRAFAKLDTIKNEIVWWDSGARSQQLLASGETPIGMFWNGRISAMQQEGMTSAKIVWKQHIPGPDMLVIPKGAKNKDAAMKFLAVAVSAQGQADFCNATSYAPVNDKAIPLIKPEMAEAMPYSHRSEEVAAGLDFWAENVTAIDGRWFSWQTA